MSKIRYAVYVSACASDHVCAYVGPATHACLKLLIYVGPIVIETLEVRRKGWNTGRVVRRLTLSTLRIRTMGGSVRSLYRLSQRRRYA